MNSLPGWLWRVISSPVYRGICWNVVICPLGTSIVVVITSELTRSGTIFRTSSRVTAAPTIGHLISRGHRAGYSRRGRVIIWSGGGLFRGLLVPLAPSRAHFHNILRNQQVYIGFIRAKCKLHTNKRWKFYWSQDTNLYTTTLSVTLVND
jgi:hypothetical protein